MVTRLSTKGQIVLPEPIRRKLGLQPGEALDAAVKDGVVMLTPKPVRRRKPRIAVDSVTGLLVLEPGHDAPPLASKAVRAFLEEMF